MWNTFKIYLKQNNSLCTISFVYSIANMVPFISGFLLNISKSNKTKATVNTNIEQSIRKTNIGFLFLFRNAELMLKLVPPPFPLKKNTPENNWPSPRVNFAFQGHMLTLDSLPAPVDSTAQGHTEDFRILSAQRSQSPCTDDVGFVVKDLFDGLRVGLH